LRRHLTYANVMSTVAVFLAVAGGYAIGQIGGDGSVRSGTVSDLDADYQTVLSVPGMGKVQAACVNGDETMIGWKTTAKPLRVTVDRQGSAFGFLHQVGSRSAYEVGLAGLGSRVQFHVVPRVPKDTPQTVVSAVGVDFSGDCAAYVSAQAVSTN
jgi:hypothetical protein